MCGIGCLNDHQSHSLRPIHDLEPLTPNGRGCHETLQQLPLLPLRAQLDITVGYHRNLPSGHSAVVTVIGDGQTIEQRLMTMRERVNKSSSRTVGVYGDEKAIEMAELSPTGILMTAALTIDQEIYIERL